MEMINKLRTHYEQYPPRLSYGGNEGKNIKGRSYQKWPIEEESKLLGVAEVKVWQEKLSANANTFSVEGNSVVDALPLWPEMEGHEFSVCVYVDMLGRIHMRAIGGFTTFKT